MRTDPSLYAAPRQWLVLGVLALALSGVLSIVLVLGRAPGVSDMLPVAQWFSSSLVAHVNLAVLYWFFAVAAMFWSLSENPSRSPVWGGVALCEGWARRLFLLAVLLMALSPSMGGEAIKSNYIPVVGNLWFFLALGLLCAAVVLMLLAFVLKTPLPGMRQADEAGLRHVAAWCMATTTLAALLAFAASTAQVSGLVSGDMFYEISFWAGGHVLQFLYTTLLLAAWAELIAAIWPQLALPRRTLTLLLLANAAPVLASPLGYLCCDITTQEHMDWFTGQMIVAGGVVPGIAGLWMLWRLGPALWQVRRAQRVPAACLLTSYVLFFMGGVYGLMIDGPNVRIPAHYHGMIIGVTVALMGLAYLWLPRLGAPDLGHSRAAFVQPLLLGVGQAMHISGLLISGGYEVLRKTPGGLQNAPETVKIAMGFVGGGGMLAIIGGLMFVILMTRALRQPASNPA